jgi:hypothetical protein
MTFTSSTFEFFGEIGSDKKDVGCDLIGLEAQVQVDAQQVLVSTKPPQLGRLERELIQKNF